MDELNTPSLVERIKEVCQELGSRDLKVGEINAQFGDLIGDSHPVHRLPDYAREQGLPNTPIQGVFLEAILEHRVRELLKRLNGLCYAGHYNIHLKKFVFPGDSLRVRFGNTTGDNGNIFVPIYLDRNGDPLDKPVVISKAKLSPAYTKLSNISGEKVYTFKKEIDMNKVSEFYRLLGLPEQETIPFMLIAATIPAALLEKYGLEGVFGSIDMEIYSTPAKSEIRTELYAQDKREVPGHKGHFLYLVRAICYQDNNPILSGLVKVSSTENRPVIKAA